jgi:hypothetical protein
MRYRRFKCAELRFAPAATIIPPAIAPINRVLAPAALLRGPSQPKLATIFSLQRTMQFSAREGFP